MKKIVIVMLGVVACAHGSESRRPLTVSVGSKSTGPTKDHKNLVSEATASASQPASAPVVAKASKPHPVPQPDPTPKAERWLPEREVPVPAAPPPAPPSQPRPVAASDATLVQELPRVWECFLDSDQGVGGGHWLRVDNRNGGHWLQLNLNSRPVIVVGPGGPIMPRPNVSVLPAGRSCFIPNLKRFRANGLEQEYVLVAKAYMVDGNSYGDAVVLDGNPDGQFPFDSDTRVKSRFTLDRGHLSTFVLEAYHFN